MTNDISIDKTKFYFIGISMSASATDDTGIVILDSDLNILKMDKVYSLTDINFLADTISSKDNSIICIDIPKKQIMLNGKWRIESKYYQSFEVNSNFKSEQTWVQRQSSRGSDIAKQFQKDGYDVFRFYSNFTQNVLNLNSPFKSRTPAACKYVQNLLEKKLGIQGIPSNMIPFSAIDGILGAYSAYKLYTGEKNKDYKIIGDFQEIPVISAISC